MRRTTDLGRQRGFTLVEAIVVIVITGIIAGIVALFVRAPVKSQLDTQARADMADAADLALRRMSRELRLALPFTVTTYNGDTAIQFLLAKTGGRYVAAANNPPATMLALDFVNGNTQFDVVGSAPTGKQAIVAGDYIALYNIGQAPLDAYAFGTTGSNNISRVAGISGTRITLAANNFTGAQVPSDTFQVVTGTVTYICTPAANGAGVLRRHFTRNIVRGVGNLAALSDTASAPVLTTMVSGCQFRNTKLPGTNTGALMTLTLFMQHANGERAQLIRQTQLDNP